MTTQSKRALIVDANEDSRGVFVYWLGKLGIEEVSEAQSGTKALIQLDRATELPDIIFVNARLRSMDGFETTQKIRAAIKGKMPIPRIVMITAGIDFEHMRALTAGADAWIDIPIVHQEQLRAAIEGDDTQRVT